METRKIGSLEVSVVGVGCNNFGTRLDSDQTATVVQAALDAGINFFDTADVYGAGKSEEYLGAALASQRDNVIIATKFGNPMEGQGSGASAAYVRTALEASLRRLGTDRIDLYQLHKPDPTVPITETLAAMSDLVKEGKVLEIGCSNFSIEQLREAEAAVKLGAARFVSVQNQYSMLKRDPEAEILHECERAGLAFLPYFPLASGLLTGKFRQGQPVPEGTRLSSGQAAARVNAENLAVVEKLVQFAEARKHTILDLAFSYLLSHKAVASVIAGATKVAQIADNAGTSRWHISEPDMAELEEILAQSTYA